MLHLNSIKRIKCCFENQLQPTFTDDPSTPKITEVVIECNTFKRSHIYQRLRLFDTDVLKCVIIARRFCATRLSFIKVTFEDSPYINPSRFNGLRQLSFTSCCGEFALMRVAIESIVTLEAIICTNTESALSNYYLVHSGYLQQFIENLTKTSRITTG